jgi:hypothetical protein
MEQSILHIEQQLKYINEASNEGLDDQSFFYTSEQPDIKHITIPTKFIMQRMLRVE